MAHLAIDFAGVGAPKCGTSWVAKQLADHPEICLSKEKEPNHFATDDLVTMFPEDFAAMRRITKAKAYENLFRPTAHTKIYGEFSVYYFYSLHALRALLAHNPNIKLILCLRDPIDSALSHYNYTRNSVMGSKLQRTFGEDIQTNDIYVKKYRFAEPLAALLAAAPREQLYIVTHDRIKHSPLQLLHELYTFLGVDATFVPLDVSKSVYQTKTIAPAHVLTLVRPIVHIMRRMHLTAILGMMHTALNRVAPTAKKVAISESEREQIVQLFAKDRAATNKLLQQAGYHQL